MPSKSATFTAAVRAVLDTEGQRDDIRQLARQAASSLPEELLFEAAVTYLTQLTRRIHNDRVRAGVESVHSEEVVWTRDGDKLLGDTDGADRDWLVANREALAAGLLRRADQIREFGAAGFAEHATTRQVLQAEREAAAIERMCEALAALAAVDESGRPVFEQEADDRIAEADRRRQRAQERSQRYRQYAETMTPPDQVFQGPAFKKTRRTAHGLVEVFGLGGQR